MLRFRTLVDVTAAARAHLGKHVNRFPPAQRPLSIYLSISLPPFFVGFRVSICPHLVQESRQQRGEGKSKEKEMQEYLLLNYPQDVRNNLKKLIKMPKEEEPKKQVNKTECAARYKKKGEWERRFRRNAAS